VSRTSNSNFYFHCDVDMCALPVVVICALVAAADVITLPHHQVFPEKFLHISTNSGLAATREMWSPSEKITTEKGTWFFTRRKIMAFGQYKDPESKKVALGINICVSGRGKIHE
jgi:hypothetical protein